MSDTTDSRASLGLVETQHVRLFDAENPLVLASGSTIPEVDVAFETYGTLSPERDNAVFICHALTGDAHAAGYHEGDRRPGWWDTLIGPGKPVDTDRFFVISANLLGGCQGTTGPSSINPATGQPYGLRFPRLQMADFVTVHRALCAHLGIERLMAVVGGSLGGMQVLEWSLSHPEDMANAVIIAASSRLTAQNIAFSAVAREAIMRDPGFHHGDYLPIGDSPNIGLSIARMMAHITYLSEEAMDTKFGRRFQDHTGQRGMGLDFAVESYLDHQGRAFLSRFDALSYLYLTRVMDHFDAFADPSRIDALARAGTQVLVMSFDTDWRFDTSHSRRIVTTLERHRVPVSFQEVSSVWGHDSFLLDNKAYHATVAAFLDRAADDLAGRRLTPKNPLRFDLQQVSQMIPARSRVLDLGCGPGKLMRELMTARACTGTGVEIDSEATVKALRYGVPLIELDIDEELEEFADHSYDVVVLSRTLQATRRPETVLREIARIGTRCIISVPNFGYWRHRWVLLRGRMPMSAELPYSWHNTPNIHLSTLHDLEDLFQSVGLTVERRILFSPDGKVLTCPDRAANMLAANATYCLVPA